MALWAREPKTTSVTGLQPDTIRTLERGGVPLEKYVKPAVTRRAFVGSSAWDRDDPGEVVADDDEIFDAVIEPEVVFCSLPSMLWRFLGFENMVYACENFSPDELDAIQHLLPPKKTLDQYILEMRGEESGHRRHQSG